MTKRNKFPQELIVYIYDYDDGEPIYAAVANIEEVPEDTDGDRVAVYVRNRIARFSVKRSMG